MVVLGVTLKLPDGVVVAEIQPTFLMYICVPFVTVQLNVLVAP